MVSRELSAILRVGKVFLGLVRFVWPLILVTCIQTETVPVFIGALLVVLAIEWARHVYALRAGLTESPYERKHHQYSVVTLGLGMLLSLFALLTPLKEGILYYPLIVNLGFLLFFFLSLFQEQTVCERIARKLWAYQHPQQSFPPEAIRYTRRVTQVWCGFFVLNGLIALLTIGLAHGGDWRAWGWWNGLGSYIAMGVLFALEFLYRKYRLGKSAATLDTALTNGVNWGLTAQEKRALLRGASNTKKSPNTPLPPTSPQRGWTRVQPQQTRTPSEEGPTQ